jgi:pyruvate dehydrogenase E1 component alpha subunit
VDPVQLLTPDGELREHDSVPYAVTPEFAREAYRHMVRCRRFDAEALALQRQGELGLWLMSLGQEAAQIGSIAALAPRDYVFPAYREHASALYRGIPPGEQLSVWRGTALAGWDPELYRFHPYSIVLGSQLLHATGYAMGIQRDGSDEVTLTYFGDGAASEGDAHEALNWAATVGAPVVFFCQNNGWALSTPLVRQTRVPLYQRGLAFGMPAYRVDGNDVLAVHAVTSLAVQAMRESPAPVFIEALTYRLAGHSTSDDPGRYRTAHELSEWGARDPILRVRRLLEREDWADAEFFAAVEADAAELAAQTRAQCLALPTPDQATLFSHVYTVDSPLVRAQRDALLEHASD